MKVERYLLPRNSVLWMIGAQGLALLPLFREMPLWLPVVWAAVLIWRLQEFRGRWPMPKPLTKTALVAVCVAGLVLSYQRLLGLEPMVALLICALLLKQLEMRRRRDALFLVYLNFFLIGVQFLFGQALQNALYGVVCLWAGLTSLLVIHQPVGQRYPWRSLKLAGRMMLHSLPLMLILFLVMPRLGALWSVPSPGQTAKTGVSDEMSPGDFSRLSRSGGVAFRATFEGESPSADQLYWRGLVLSEFDGRTWRQNRDANYHSGAPVYWGYERPPKWLSGSQGAGRSYRYSIVMEPSHQRWLYSLSLVAPVADQDIGLVWDYRLLRNEPVHTRFSYEAQSQLEYALNLELPEWQRQRALQLPSSGNPVSRTTAAQWRAESTTDEAYIKRILELYRSRFTYTLEPPALGTDTVDEFLWQTEQGFCGHFASSFVFMLRSAGIPARVVAGYQGGEYNPLGDYWVVHQYDAHAWAEVWLPQKGWVRYDPTAVVAPDRIRQSLGETRSEQVDDVVSLGRYRHIQWLSNIRLQWDLLNYRWHKTVLEFDQEEQSKFLTRWLGRVDPLKLMLVLLTAGAVTVLIVTLHLWWTARPVPQPRHLRWYRRFERRVARRGWYRQPSETPEQFLQRMLQKETSLSYCEVLKAFTQQYLAHVYGGQPLDEPQLKSLLHQLRT